MARVAALADGAVRVGRAVRVDLVGTVILLAGGARGARQVGVDLGADADAVADAHRRHLGPDAHRAPDDLVPDAQRQRHIAAPPARDGVHVGRAHAARLDGHVDVAVLERLELDLRQSAASPGLRTATTHVVALEVTPFLEVGDDKGVGRVGIAHAGGVRSRGTLQRRQGEKEESEDGERRWNRERERRVFLCRRRRS